MKKDGFTRELRGKLFGALTGRAGDVSGQPDGDVRGMLMAVGGPARTKSGIDLSAAAKSLGVTRRTVERWVTDATEKGKPRGKNLDNLVGKARQAATTKQGRRAALANARKGPMTRYGAKMTVRGEQGPTMQGKDYRRFRKLDLVLTPESVEEMLDAYERGGDKAFLSWLEGYTDENYLEGWGFDSIADMDLTDPRESGW
jgi:transposase